MKKNAIKIFSSAVAVMVLSGCAYSSDALFPSLFGSDSQEARSSNSQNSNVPNLGTTNFKPLEVSEGSSTGTFVGQKVVTFRHELTQLQNVIVKHNEQLQKIRTSVITNAVQYHKVVGLIEAKLQVGTTPGNPEMYSMLQSAQNNIQYMNANTLALSQLGQQVTADSAMTSYLLDSIKAAYGISGAVDADHSQLRILENETNQTSILIKSLLVEIHADNSRQQQYIQSVKTNIVDLNSSIRDGSYGVNNVSLASSGVGSAPSFAPANVSTSKPLFVAKFNKTKVNYKDGLKHAVTQSLRKKPGVMFEVVAVAPASGNHLSKASAKNNATTIFQDMIEMGVGADKITLSAKNSVSANSSEVHIYVK